MLLSKMILRWTHLSQHYSVAIGTMFRPCLAGLLVGEGGHNSFCERETAFVDSVDCRRNRSHSNLHQTKSELTITVGLT
jgi:hypothetical protein